MHRFLHNLLRKALLLVSFLLILSAHSYAQVQIPPGFTDTPYASWFFRAIGFTFDANGQMYVWERSGRVWTVINGVKTNTPLIDLREEVLEHVDHGLLSVALDPRFQENGYIYLMYVVDRHYLYRHGQPDYDPNRSDAGATIIRVTRYTAQASNQFKTIVPNSRRVLIGESASTGVPILSGSHAGGDLVFGADGTLLISTGEAGSLAAKDQGSEPTSDYAQALNEGIITPLENIGSFRSQYVDSHDGKILRINPATGDGVSSNPFYDASKPRSPRSRVFASGLRNPFRMSKRPQTGSTNPADGQPGTFYISDVGSSFYEEVNVLTAAGQNFGWPFREGINYNPEFNQVPAYISRNFVHAAPKIAYGRQSAQLLEHGNPVVVPNSQLPYQDVSRGGNCVIDGGWQTTSAFPADYQNSYFFADYGRGWIAYGHLDSENEPHEVHHFGSGFNEILHLRINPIDGNLYYLTTPHGTIRRISYGGNQPPEAVISASAKYGTSPLTIAFDGSASNDPGGGAISYRWNFGDDTPESTEPKPTHTFTASGVASYTVKLTVTDAGGATHQAQYLVSVNNTPPVIQSVSFANLNYIDPLKETTVNLSAVVADAEHGANQLSYSWLVGLFHNDHNHDDPAVQATTTTVKLPALGPCNHIDEYWYRINLTVTDANGLATVYFKDIYPNCAGLAQTINFPPIAKRAVTQSAFEPTIWATSGLPVKLYIVDGPAFISGQQIHLTGKTGVVKVRAIQPGNSSYQPAQAVEQSFLVLESLSMADLRLSMRVDKQTVASHELVVFAVTVQNNGPDAANNVTVQSRLPAGLEFVSSASLTNQQGVVSGTIPTLPYGAVETLYFRGKAVQAGSFVTAAQLTASSVDDPNSQPNSGTGDGQDDMAQVSFRTLDASGQVFVSPNPNQVPLPSVQENQPTPQADRADLSLHVATSSRTPLLNDVITITLTVKNRGGLTATNITVRNVLPAGLQFVSSPHMSSSGNAVQGTIGTLGAGGSTVLTFQARVAGGGRIINQAEISAVGQPDSDSQPGNGTSNGEDDTAQVDLRVGI